MHLAKKGKTKKSLAKKDALKELSHIQFHGAKMLASGESSWYWVPVMLLLLVSAIGLIYLTVRRFQCNPTYIGYKEMDYGVMNFPCVLVYPEIDFHESKKDDFLSNMIYPDDLNKTYVRTILPQLSAFWSPDVDFKLRDLENLEKILSRNNFDIESAGRQLTETCEEIILRCRWNNIYYNCSEIFNLELAGDGFTCVFNGRSLIREMRERAKGNKIDIRNTNWYTKEAGVGSGLMLAIDQKQIPQNIDLSYKWIALQVGQRFVDISLNGTALNRGTEQWMIYKTQSYNINDGAKNLRTALRNCIMAEQPLKYFPVYRRRYCILECEIAKTMKLCNCVRRVHPKPRGVRYCRAKDLLCANRAMVSYGTSCHCLSTCEVDVDSLRTSSFLLDSSVEPIDHFYDGLHFENITIVRIFIQAGPHRTYERVSFYTYMDLFSQLGGMFSVCFGCSILTILGLLHVVWRISVNTWMKFLKKI